MLDSESCACADTRVITDTAGTPNVVIYFSDQILTPPCLPSSFCGFTTFSCKLWFRPVLSFSGKKRQVRGGDGKTPECVFSTANRQAFAVGLRKQGAHFQATAAAEANAAAATTAAAAATGGQREYTVVTSCTLPLWCRWCSPKDIHIYMKPFFCS